VSHKRRVWEEIAGLSKRVAEIAPVSGDTWRALEKELVRLGREQFKANALAESQAQRLEAALEALRKALEQQDQMLAQVQTTQTMIAEKARLETLQTLLPVVDGLEAALASGQNQLNYLQTQAPVGAEMLAAWLDGLRLLRERVLAVLAHHGIKPVAAVGAMFDPYCHVAVGVVEDTTLPPGRIVEEHRRGYIGPSGVLRYAEVVVTRSPTDTEQGENDTGKDGTE